MAVYIQTKVYMFLLVHYSTFRLASSFLGMFVLRKIATSCSAISAPRNLTGVGALPRVAAHMQLEIASLGCTVATPRDLTGVRTLPRVG